MSARRSSVSASLRWLKAGLAGLSLVVSAPAAVACPLCYEAARQGITIGQQLDAADRVVLAAPLASRFRIVEVVKGKGAIGDIIADPVAGLDASAGAGSDSALLVGDPLAQGWISLGAIRAEYADWLRQLAATRLIKGDRPRPTGPQSMQGTAAL